MEGDLISPLRTNNQLIKLTDQSSIVNVPTSLTDHALLHVHSDADSSIQTTSKIFESTLKSKSTLTRINQGIIPLKLVVVNCQSILAKKPLFDNFVACYKPDIIVGSESWLKPDIANSEIFSDE